jgi:Protein of unknown function with HXXEE motif
MRKLVVVTFAVDVLVIALGAWLLRQSFIPDQHSLILAFLFPIAFSFHVLEEFVFPGRGEEWFRLYRPEFASRYTEAYFVKVNAIGAAAAALVPLGLFDYRGGFSFGGVAANMIFASTMLANAYYHARGTIELRRYSPGVITSLVLYVPLAMALYAQLLKAGATGPVTALICLVLGSQLQRVIDSTHRRALKKEARP